jgi:hypothetical protein
MQDPALYYYYTIGSSGEKRMKTADLPHAVSAPRRLKDRPIAFLLRTYTAPHAPILFWHIDTLLEVGYCRFVF